MLHSKTLEISRLRDRIADPQRAEAGDQAPICSPVIKASGASCVDDEIMRTGLVYHPAYLEHDMGPGHPESPNRLRAIMQQLEQSGTMARVTKIEPRKAEDEWITQVHTPGYASALNRAAPTTGRVSLDPDTSMSPGSLNAAYLAAGGALAAVDAIMAQQVEHVFCA